MNVLIIEDQRYQAEILASYLAEYKEIQFECEEPVSKVEDAISFLKMTPRIDLILADVELEDGNVFKLFHDPQLKLDLPVIFLTIHPNYTMDAFYSNCIHYLIKPITKPKLDEAVEKLKKFQQIFSQQVNNLKSGSLTIFKPLDSRVLFKIGNKKVFIEARSIAYIYLQDKLVYMYEKEGKRWLIDHSLDEAIDILGHGQFFRANRQIIISRASLQKFYSTTRGRIKLELDPPIQDETLISFKNRKIFLKWVEEDAQ